MNIWEDEIPPHIDLLIVSQQFKELVEEFFSDEE